MASERAAVQYNTVHDSAGHGGQGERRREDEGRMGGVRGEVKIDPDSLEAAERLKCGCECVSV